MTTLHPMHDCRIDGQIVRHRAPIDVDEVPLNGGGLRLQGARCDGSRIHIIAKPTAGGFVTLPEAVSDVERLMWDHGREYVSVALGPWEPIPGEDDEPPAQLDLFGGAA